MENELPKRKDLRLKNYDYSTEGAYFVTICVQDRKQILSEITNQDSTATNKTMVYDAVGEGLAPPENESLDFDKIGATTGAASYSPTSFHKYLSSVEHVQMQLKEIGKICVEQLFALEKRFPSVKIDEYVIMPDHIHVIIILRKIAEGSRPSPTLVDVMRVFKSLTSRICKQRYGVQKLFQRSYIERVIRAKDDYETRRKYIYENPLRWQYDKLYSEE